MAEVTQNCLIMSQVTIHEDKKANEAANEMRKIKIDKLVSKSGKIFKLPFVIILLF